MKWEKVLGWVLSIGALCWIAGALLQLVAYGVVTQPALS